MKNGLAFHPSARFPLGQSNTCTQRACLFHILYFYLSFVLLTVFPRYLLRLGDSAQVLGWRTESISSLWLDERTYLSFWEPKRRGPFLYRRILSFTCASTAVNSRYCVQISNSFLVLGSVQVPIDALALQPAPADSVPCDRPISTFNQVQKVSASYKQHPIGISKTGRWRRLYGSMMTGSLRRLA
jgi:hypothetical protein